MHILMIAPEPYFEPRGTPFSEYFRIKALGELGHSVDLVTYPIGQDRSLPGLRIIRAPNLLGARSVKTGPSLKKVFLDILLFFRVLARVAVHRYDLVHTHEEGCLMGVVVGKLRRIPHLYDMHSSLVQQLDNFQFSRSRLLRALFGWVERTALRQAKSVIVICRSLQEHAAALVPPERLTLIENFLDESLGEAVPSGRVEELRRRLAPAGQKLVVYTGTFEAYQGIPLLLEAAARLEEGFRPVLVGGSARQVEEAMRQADRLGIGSRLVLTGQRPAEEIPLYLRAADVLVSPRVRGTNIPLKIYSYLKSGVPVVATNLPTHTQTVTPEIAFLVDPDPAAFAEGIRQASGPLGQEVARRAAAFCRERYSPERYRLLVSEAVEKAFR